MDIRGKPLHHVLKRDLEFEGKILAALCPRTLAAMHGSTFVGDGAAALIASGDVIREVTSVPVVTA